MHTDCQLAADHRDFINPLFSMTLGRRRVDRQILALLYWPNSTKGGGFRPARFGRVFPVPGVLYLSGNFCALSRVQYR
jgi:hypothetical protein